MADGPIGQHGATAKSFAKELGERDIDIVRTLYPCILETLAKEQVMITNRVNTKL